MGYNLGSVTQKINLGVIMQSVETAAFLVEIRKYNKSLSAVPH